MFERMKTLVSIHPKKDKIIIAKNHFRTFTKCALCSLSSASADLLIHNAILDNEATIPYIKGWAWQNLLLNYRLQLDRMRKNSTETKLQNSFLEQDCLLMLHLDHVYTLGRGSDENNLTFLKNHPESQLRLSKKVRGPGTARLSYEKLFINEFESKEDGILKLSESVSNLSGLFDPVMAPNNVPIYRIERGGEVTYHGPGQLVVFPLLNLKESKHFRQDLHWYIRSLEDVILKTLEKFDIHGVRDSINTGVWVNQNKIAAIGISSSRWITTHGLAININPNLSYFDTSLMIPCGVQGRGVTSIFQEYCNRSQNTNDCPSLSEVAEATIQSFEEIFDISTDIGITLD